MYHTQNRFIPQVQELPRRDLPAQLLAVTAAQLATLHDVAGISDGEADSGTAVALPAKGQNAVIRLDPDVLAVFRGGVLVDSHWTGGAAPALYAQAFAQAEGLPLYDVTMNPADDDKLPADAGFISALQEAAVGSAFTDAELTDALDALPATLTDQPGQPLQLAVVVEGGFMVHTLTPTTQYGLLAWTLDSSVFASGLTPDVYGLVSRP